MAREMDKSLTNALCAAFSGTAVLCQIFFWIEILFYKQVSEGSLKFMYYSAGLLGLIFCLLIVHNTIRFVFWTVNRS